MRQIPHCLHLCCCSVAKLCPPLCDSTDWLQGLQHIRLLCPSLSPWVCSNSCPLSQWCYPIISSSVAPFSFCLQSFPAAGSSPMNQLFISVGQSIEASASASVLPMNIQGWFPLGLTSLISLQSQGLSRVFSSTAIWKHQFFSAQPALWFNFLAHVLKMSKLKPRRASYLSWVTQQQGWRWGPVWGWSAWRSGGDTLPSACKVGTVPEPSELYIYFLPQERRLCSRISWTVAKPSCLCWSWWLERDCLPFAASSVLTILKEMGIPDHLICLLRNLYAGQEATVRTGHGTTDWFQIGKGVSQGCILSPCLFNFYAEYIMRNAGLEET